MKKRNTLIFEVDEQTGKNKRKLVRYLTKAADMCLATDTPVKAVGGFISHINLVFLFYHAAVYFTLKSIQRYQR